MGNLNTFLPDNHAIVKLLLAGEHLHQGRFPGAITAKQGDPFTGLQLQAQPIKYNRAVKLKNSFL